MSTRSGPMEHWQAGYTQSQLDDAQDRYQIRFPPDLIALFLEMRPISGYRWETEDTLIRDRLVWPTKMLLGEVENGSWWPGWGDRPSETGMRLEVAREAITKAPRLIPLIAHRFIPETPNEAGNPIFSMYGFDTIYYGADLNEYFANEFAGTHNVGETRHIEFWSDITEGWQRVTTEFR